jgi:hypothetical protein
VSTHNFGQFNTQENVDAWNVLRRESTAVPSTEPQRRQQSPIPEPRPDPVEALNVQMQRLQGNMSQLRDATAKLQASYEQLDAAHMHLKNAVINLQLALQRGDKHE